MSERIERLTAAIMAIHNCSAIHAGSTAVFEIHQIEVVPDGIVETFILVGHPQAKRCHAWGYWENGESQYIAVLELPPVVGPNSAVQAEITARLQNTSAAEARYP